MKISKRKINIALLSILVFICVFFPGDPLNLKILSLFILLITNCKLIVAKIAMYRYRPVLFMGIIYPISIMIWSTFLTGDIRSAIAGAYAPVMILLLIVIVEEDIEYKRILLLLLKIMSLAIILIAAGDMIGLFNINGGFIHTAFYKYDMGLLGKSVSYSTYYRIFFKASPILVVLLDDSISKRNIMWVFISFSALFFSGTRANVIAACAIIVIRYTLWTERKGNMRYLIALIFVLAGLLLLPDIFRGLSHIMTTAGSLGSDATRLGEFKSYIDVFSDIFTLLFGMGFGSEYYSYGRNMLITTSELSYFELIRCTGLFLAIPFFVFVIKPIESKKVRSDYKLSYIFYLLIAMTNPFLISSTAMIIYIFYYSDIVMPKTKNVNYAEGKLSYE